MILKVKLPAREVFSQTFPSARVLIGRSSKCDFVVHSDFLSRQHCVVEFEDGAFFLTDQNSVNGVYIDGARIQPQIRNHYSNFAPLHFGQQEITIADNSDVDDQPSTLTLNVTASPGSKKEIVEHTACIWVMPYEKSSSPPSNSSLLLSIQRT